MGGLEHALVTRPPSSDAETSFCPQSVRLLQLRCQVLPQDLLKLVEGESLADAGD